MPTAIAVEFDSGSALNDLEAALDARSILTHPFYTAWQRGELSREALADYAGDYYHHIRAFPSHIAALEERAPDAEARRLLHQNLCEEEEGPENHPELWLRFAEGVGASRKQIAASAPSAESQALTQAFAGATRGSSFAAGLAALYAYERQMPAVSTSKIDGLRTFYGITDARALAYFRVHESMDVRHAEEARRLLAANLGSRADCSDASAGANGVLDALWQLLTAIGARHGVYGC